MPLLRAAKALFPVSLLLSACAAPRPKVVELSSFRRAEAKDSVVVEYHRDRGGVAEDVRETWYVFTLEGVPDSGVGHLTYQGTERGHHLFRIFQEQIVDNTLEYNVAVREAECAVEDPQGIQSETTKRGARKAARAGGRCIVAAGKESE